MGFAVRHDADSRTLKAILLCNMLNHAVSLMVDLLAVAQGMSTIVKSAPILVTHMLIIAGALYYAVPIRRAPT